MTTIKDHIDAGRYPRDDKGRALVPTRGGYPAVICATDCTERDKPLLGWYALNQHRGESCSWYADGKFECGNFDGNLDLLPPPPRKVKVTRWMVAAPHFESVSYSDRDDAVARTRTLRGSFIVELTGEYEESW